MYQTTFSLKVVMDANGGEMIGGSFSDVGYLLVEGSRVATLGNNHLPSIEQDRVAERAEAKLRTKCARSGAILFNVSCWSEVRSETEYFGQQVLSD